ncbi:uncharacterized protein B0H18DRAFT_1114955 [Fomitopsis serialis]|uniref:uncharacterized protein n=1 Tax=Fomitopsis serialis TaxID=139415 RepID=UPI0020073A82|nr:uncharacterized protein B0H18DRAFT_1114955 [Neoantrodia serialis]KAH9934215.1 hypothetical protein B0H18DRAFT_1114955 [Neoantrodia serialis]
MADRIHESGWTLKRVASTHHMVHLGRPLFGAMYDAGSEALRKNVVDFAKIKLLYSEADPELLTSAQSLACIGVRIPIDFKAYVPADLENERILVARHLRSLLYAGRRFAGAVMACPSEPLLAEAAYMVLARKRWSNGEAVMSPAQTTDAPRLLEPIPALSYHLSHSHLDLGTRGETVAAVLLLDARDRATTFPLAHGDLSPGTDDTEDDEDLRYDGVRKRRIVTVTQFLRALLAKPCHDIIPAEYHKPEDAGVPLETAFKDCFVYFNHFIKAASSDMVNQRYLRLAMSRGAAFICADSQGGIDIIIPCLFGTVLVREKVSAIMIQVKNDTRCTAKVDPVLFASMDPYRCGVFDSGVKDPPPVLRIVFALASRESSVTAASRWQRASTSSIRPARFTAYDIWCAGSGPSTFGVVQRGEADVLDNLLKTLRGPGDVERLYNDDVSVSVVRAMRPMTSTDCSHFDRWVDRAKDTIGKEQELLEPEPEDAVAPAELMMVSSYTASVM